jgi:heme A synthase
MRQDFAATSVALLRLRMLHPVAALLGASFILWTAYLSRGRRGAPRVHRAATIVISVVLFQIAVGICNVGLLAPVWMQLFHLLVADLVWIAIGVMVLELAYLDADQSFGSGGDDRPSDEGERLTDPSHEWRHISA